MGQNFLFDNSLLPVNQYGYPIESVRNAEELARSNDPETSKSAARKVAPSARQLAVRAAELVRKNPGLTGAELDRLAGCEVKRTFSKRLADAADRYGLVKRGPKRKCKVGGNDALTWEPL